MQMRNLFVAVAGAAGAMLMSATQVHAAAWIPPSGGFGHYVYDGGQDTEGQFGSPTAFSANSLQFEPPAFRATSINGSAGFATDTMKFNLGDANAAKTIKTIALEESGDYSIDNGGGVKAYAGLFVRVLDADWSFSTRVFPGTFTSTPNFPLDANSAEGTWFGTMTVTLPAFARSVSITLNDTLQSHSNVAGAAAGGGSAFIQKKEVDITVNTPEPTTLAVIFGGVGFAAIRRRKA